MNFKQEIDLLDLKQNIQQKKFSFFNRPISNTVPEREVILSEVYQLISSDKFKFVTQRCRVAKDSKLRGKIKSSDLDYVTFSGIFTKRSNDSLVQHSGLIVFDFDKLKNVEEFREKLTNDPMLETGLLFRSPSGDGLKWVIPIDLEQANHLQWFQSVANYIKQTYGIEIDQSGKDVSRACFLCHDPEAYLNPKYSETDTDVDKESIQPKFNPNDWLQVPQLVLNDKKPEFKAVVPEDVNANPILEAHYIFNKELIHDVEKVVSAIEQKRIDLTTAYENWRDFGFALADSLGERGREYYHRVSKFYPLYDTAECDTQYQRCLDSKGTGITISTLFHHAKSVGAMSSTSTAKETYNETLPPFIPDAVYEKLPDLFTKCTEITQRKQEKDVLLLGSIVTISSCMQNVTGIYDNKRVYSNLFFFLSGKAGSGKSVLENAKQLVIPIHNSLKKESEDLHFKHRKEIAHYNSEKQENPNLEKPLPPCDKVLIIPANISSSGMYLLLANNDGRGLIFETEGDTLANTFRNKDFGDFSDGFRKAFHNETISLFRKTNNEFIEIEKPQLAAVLSGTPRQILSLIPNAENGLFSRFIYYTIAMEGGWKNVFANKGKVCYEDYFAKLGNEFYSLNCKMEESGNIDFEMTTKQEVMLNDFFEQKEKQLVLLYGDDFKGAVHRLGLIMFRIAMILTAIRNLEKGVISSKIVCEDVDFNNSMKIIEVLIEHSKYIFQGLPQTPQVRPRENQKEKFLRLLPDDFCREDYAMIAESTGINLKTAEGYIKRFCDAGLLNHFSHNKYLKTATGN